MSRIAIGQGLGIDESELSFVFLRAAGPGGQNVNKVETAVQLRFDIRASPSLPEDIKRRLERLAGRRMSSEGVLVIAAQRFRSQERNKQDALARLTHLIARAAERPKRRIATRPSLEAQRRRREAKQRHSRVKRLRGRPVE